MRGGVAVLRWLEGISKHTTHTKNKYIEQEQKLKFWVLCVQTVCISADPVGIDSESLAQMHLNCLSFQSFSLCVLELKEKNFGI